jgi:hypothetical protein
VRVAAEQPNTGVARQVSRLLEVDLAVGEQRVDVVGADLHLGHARPARRHDVLGVVLVGGQADRTRLHAQRDVLADEGDQLALGREVGGAGQDARVVAVRAEARGQNRGIAVVELHLQRTALCPNGNGLIEAAVFEAQIVEHPQRLTREPPEFVMVSLGFELADHDQRDNHLVFREPGARPRIG